MNSRLFAKYRYSLILLRELVITEFKLRYQGSALGYLWSLLRPLFLFVTTYIVFVYFLKIGSNIPHWPIALLMGIVLWNFFAEITNNGLSAVVGRGDVIRKINFPKYVIIFAASVSALINLALNLIVIVIFMAFNHVDLTWFGLTAPLYILEIFLFGLGLAFILSSIFVRLRDVNYIWEILMQALFYASAIMYPLSYVVEKSHVIAGILLLNPVTQAIQDMRYGLINHQNQTLFNLVHNPFADLIPMAIVVIVFIAGALYFRKKSPTFAENI